MFEMTITARVEPTLREKRKSNWNDLSQHLNRMDLSKLISNGPQPVDSEAYSAKWDEVSDAEITRLIRTHIHDVESKKHQTMAYEQMVYTISPLKSAPVVTVSPTGQFRTIQRDENGVETEVEHPDWLWDINMVKFKYLLFLACSSSLGSTHPLISLVSFQGRYISLIK